MSSQTIALNTGQQAIIHTELSKVFLWNRRSQPGQVQNSGLYDPITIPEGTVMGRIAASSLLTPFTSGASDGSQFPVGVLIETQIIQEGDTQNVFICDDGDVAAEKLIFQGSDDLDTVVSGRQVRDHLKSFGIKVITATDMTPTNDND
jgi:hypothetical protein